jgi:uncharacterized membrane protein HdeD (DUF308 family)
MLKSKTIWFAILTAAAGIVQQLTPFIPPDKIGWLLGVIAAATAGLRAVTDSPLFNKEPK